MEGGVLLGVQVGKVGKHRELEDAFCRSKSNAASPPTCALLDRQTGGTYRATKTRCVLQESFSVSVVKAFNKVNKIHP